MKMQTENEYKTLESCIMEFGYFYPQGERENTEHF